MHQTVLLALLVTALADFRNLQAAPTCEAAKCQSPDCRCFSTTPPAGIDAADIPQFVFLTFDDAVEALNYETYSSLFYNRTNPDGCPITVTFFMSHDYTDYSKVHDLYIHNHEIALHSVTHDPQIDYWKNIAQDQMNHEFGDERKIITTFAKIPEDAIKGMRLPHLQLSGDNSFQTGKELGLLYDCSWPTQTYRKPGLWPYTLDYRSNQDCPIGPCPTSSIPGLWIVPMIDWTDQANFVCNMVDGCVNIPNDVDELFQWFVDNFNVQYQGNRAPFGFFLHNAYFATNPIHLDAYQKFVDYLQGLNDVYLDIQRDKTKFTKLDTYGEYDSILANIMQQVSPSQAIEWIKKPIPLNSPDWPQCAEIENLGCDIQTCPLQKGEEMRYMTLCGPCPEIYPWLNNPLGENLD